MKKLILLILFGSTLMVAQKDANKKLEDHPYYEPARMLIHFGSEIITKNETNTLLCTKFSPIIRTVTIPENEKKAYNQNCMNECNIVDVMPAEMNKFSCFQYALEKIIGAIGFEEEINFPGRLFSIFVERFFEQTENPQPNDLVIYTYDENDLMMTHFAIVIDNNTVESKWGYFPEIRRHKLLNIHTDYGNAAWFYSLKKEYRGTQGKEKAIAEIQEFLNLQKQILIQMMSKQ